VKRLLLAAAATAALAIGVAAAPVHADDTPPSPGNGAGITGIVNPILALVPGPPGWGERHVCVGSQQVDHYWCFFFPFPT
jgi:hypothetical protein